MDDNTPLEIQTPSSPTVKPALKHPAKHPPENTNGPIDMDGKKEKHLTWDEHAIEEHDLLRGTRMKIDEPNTPFTHYDHSDDEHSSSSERHPRSPDEKNSHNAQPIAWNALQSKLQVVANKRDACPHSPAASRDGASDSEGEAEMKRRKAKQEEHDQAFKDHRKKHYNEAEAMKRWRMEHMDDSDENDEEEDGGDGNL